VRFGVAAEAKTPLVPAKPAAPSAGVVCKPLMGAWVTIGQRAATFRWHLMTASGDQQRPPQRLMKYHACRAGGAAGGPATVVDSGINPARVLHRPFPSPGGALASSVSMPDHAAKHRHFGPMSPPDNTAIRSAVRYIGEDEQYRIVGAAINSAAAHAAPEPGQGDTLDTYRYYQDFAAGRAAPRTPNAPTPPTPTAPAATTAPNTCTSTRKPKRANQSAKFRYNRSGVSQRPTDLQRGPHLENAALGPPLSKPSQTLIHVQATKSAFSTGHSSTLSSDP
jgi:hypothetical protein